MTLFIVIIVAILLYVMVAYNGMIKLRNRVKEAWSDIDVQLKRRYNVIPNIVETVKGYAAHEEGVFTQITEARANAINATSIKDQGAAENMLSGALKSLFAVAENYPDLKANENFMQLQNELVDTEDKIQSARRFYNSVVKDFNTKIQQFPAKVIAQTFKFKAEEFFEVEDEEQKEPIEVEFSKEGTRQAEAPEAAAATSGGAVETTQESSPAEEKESEKEEAPAEEPKEEKPEEPAEEPAEETPAEEPKEEEKPEEEAPTEEPKEEEKEEEEKPVEEEPAEEPKEEPKEEEAPEEPKPEETEEKSEEEKPEKEAPAEEPKKEEEKPEKEAPAEEPKKEEEKPAEEEKPDEQTEMPLEGGEEKK